MGWLGLLLLTLSLLCTLSLSRRPLQGTTWLLLRSLLPSWRFFEDIELGPELTFCLCPVGGEPGPWLRALAPPPRRLLGLLSNPDGNTHLALRSVVDQLWSELDGTPADEAERLVPYRLVMRLVELRARELHPSAGAHYRFRLSEGAESEFVSPEHPL
jgi:hypothetical protein